MTRWLVLRLFAPLAAFGGEAIDAKGVTRDFPALSALTGLFANALGWERHDREAHQRLQERIVFAARRDAEPPLGRMTDFQTAKLDKGDKGWTTRGAPEERAGGAETYASPHIRRRDYHADARLTVVVRLEPEGPAPTLDDLAAALDRPARPLFIGRKPCLPSRRLVECLVEARDAHAAITMVPVLKPEASTRDTLRALWPAENGGAGTHESDITDERNWISGLHGGARRVREGRVSPPRGEEG